jgi:uncharacterized protein YndB with AHSA1/START domain
MKDLTTVEIYLTIQAPVATVFEALTTSESLAAWFSEFADVSPANNRYDFWGRFTPEAPGQSQGRHVLRTFNPNQALAFDWRVRQAETAVQFQLEPQGAGTKLLLRHQGVPAAQTSDYTFSDFWSLSLENLRGWLEGQTIGARCDFSTIQRGRQVRLDVDIEAGREAVFEALIRPEALQRYIATQATVDPQVGGSYSYGWAEGGPVKILDLVPEQRLSFSWTYPNEPETIVTWSLEGSGSKTHLTLVHSGFAPNRNNGDYQVGWLKYVHRLKFLVEVGASWRKPETASSD